MSLFNSKLRLLLTILPLLITLDDTFIVSQYQQNHII